jgi:hypothetical protein
VRSTDGTITTFACDCGDTFVTGANDLGVAVGYGSTEAFIRAPDGSFTYFDAGDLGLPMPAGINDQGVVTGTVVADGKFEGFIRAADGTLTIFDAPNDVKGTFPTSINSAGKIVGRFYDTNGQAHGFVRTARGKISVFDPRKSKSTYPTSINDNGAIAGSYTDRTGFVFGFTRAP